MLIGFFIEPDASVKKLIINHKRLVKKKYGDQIYLNHPPHLTILTIKLKKKLLRKDIFEINTFVNSFKKNIITITNTDFFYNDPQVKGNTMFFSVKKNVYLSKLQIKLVEFLKKKFGNSIIKKNKFLGIMKKNHNLYGYPFIGKNWKPHFTISSINKNKDLNLIRPYIKKKLNISFRVQKISIWLIKKNLHQKLKTINFK
jgi:hypothetical protein